VGVDLPLVDPSLENGDPTVDDDFLPSLSSSSSAPWGEDRFEAAVAVVGAAGVVEERVGVVEDDGESVGEIVVAAAGNEDELFDDNVVAAAVDGEAAPPTLSAPNAAPVPNVPVVAAPAVSKPRDVEDTAFSPSVSPSGPYPSPSPSRVDASPCPPPFPYRYPCPCPYSYPFVGAASPSPSLVYPVHLSPPLTPFPIELAAESRDFVNNPVDFDVDMGGCEYGDECEGGGELLSKMWRAEAEVTSPEDVDGRDE